MEYFDLEKLTVFFVMYSSAPKEQKVKQLFDLISIKVQTSLSDQHFRVISPKDEHTIHRIFAYMAICTCLIPIEILRGQGDLPRKISAEALAEMDEKYRLSSTQNILNNYAFLLRVQKLFTNFRQEPITIEQFWAMFNKSPENEGYLMFITPERFRYNYLVEYIHA